jgi:hypothetical protein
MALYGLYVESFDEFDNAATNIDIFSFTYALYETNISQVPQEFVEKIRKYLRLIWKR